MENGLAGWQVRVSGPLWRAQGFLGLQINPKHSMYAIYAYIGVVGGQCRHIWHTWSVWEY